MKLPSSYLITNAMIINDGKAFLGSVEVDNGFIIRVGEGILPYDGHSVNLEGKWLLPGVIDDQVHFREPGLTHKADIFTESLAAAAGGVTSFMDMPNTNPQTLTQELLRKKFEIGANRSVLNYSFYMGVSNDNLEEVLHTDPSKVCGIKVFLGASSGNMLVDNPETLRLLFAKAPTLVAAHCEHEPTIQANLQKFKEKYGDSIPVSAHPAIRSSESCFISSAFAISLAKEYGTRLHILHLSTAEELQLFDVATPLKDKKITAEVCVQHLYFDDRDYEEKGSLIKWNPAIKSKTDRDALRAGLIEGSLDVVATDHAPHTLEEKSRPYSSCPSGGPMVQHSLVVMMDMALKGLFSPEFVVGKMCHAPADCFQIDRRGYIREGYYADLVVMDPKAVTKVTRDNVLYKCGWSPLEGRDFQSAVTHTIVNGHLVFCEGWLDKSYRGRRLEFNR